MANNVFFLLILLFISGQFIITCVSQGTWCVANPLMNSTTLIANIDYACSRVDCSQIQEGGLCFYPNNNLHHASFAMNLHYQVMGRHVSDCDFRGSGLVSLTDPSFGSCNFETGGAAGEVVDAPAPTEQWCVAKPGTRDDLLQNNINFACNHVDCSQAIDFDGSCYNPTTIINHASFAMNLYFQTTGRTDSSCDFHQTGLIVVTDPSYGQCFYSNSAY